MSLFTFAVEELCPIEESQRVLQPLFSEMSSIWQLAFEMYQTTPPIFRSRLGRVATAKPVILNALAQTFAQEIFCDREDEGIFVCDVIPQVFIFRVQNCIVRFNRLGADGCVGNIKKSPLKLRYFNQEPIGGLYNEATRFTAGYRLDESGTEIQTIEISLQLGDTLVYRYPINRPDTLQMPISENRPTPVTPTTVIRRAR